jgi:DMSO/TMAO reductase YedYZ molybdopterin-dependent catalytic subunit
MADLDALDQVDMTAVLDCTSGWAIETTWRGVPLSAVVAIPDRGSIRVRSITGWSTILTADEAWTALLATGVAGQPLPLANGAPARLVVPGRRGLDWVKWVTRIEAA